MNRPSLALLELRHKDSWVACDDCGKRRPYWSVVEDIGILGGELYERLVCRKRCRADSSLRIRVWLYERRLWGRGLTWPTARRIPFWKGWVR